LQDEADSKTSVIQTFEQAKIDHKNGRVLAQRFRNPSLDHLDPIREGHPGQRFCAFLLKPFSVAKPGNRRAVDLDRRRYYLQEAETDLELALRSPSFLGAACWSLPWRIGEDNGLEIADLLRG